MGRAARIGRVGGMLGALLLAGAATTVGIALIWLSATPALASPSSGSPLVGTFELTPGSCSGGAASGTYLRMVLSGGTNASGPYFSNSDSSCSDNTYTPLAPGSGRGLVTGSYQSEPSPAFDGSGNALSSQITAPVAFEGVRFGTSSNAVDPQTGLHAPAPSIVATGTALSGNVQSFGVSWNNQQFNQGSPKPDGSSPGNTTPVTGVYNPATGGFTLEWSSQVVGGPFNGFSAYWHLTGTFVAASASPATASGVTPTQGGGASATSTAHGAAGATSSSSPASPGASVTTPAAGSSGTSPAAGSGTASAPTTVPTSGAPAVAAPQVRTVSASHTVTSGTAGWQAPEWLVVLVAALAVVGLLGVLVSERALRRVRSTTASAG